VLRDWNGDTPKAEFLREVRDGSCRLFSTVLSPDYNAARADPASRPGREGMLWVAWLPISFRVAALQQ